MTAKTDVTVIINTYHERPERLRAGVEAIVPQVKEVIISYCEGDPNTGLIASLGTLTAELPLSKQIGKCPLQSFRQIENAMPLVQTEYTSWASGDDVVNTDKYEREMNLMQSTPGAMVVYSDYTFTDENMRPINRCRLRDYSFDWHREGNIVSDLAVWKTSLYHEFVFRHEEFRNYAFWDFWLRIYEKYGDVFAHLPESTWLYRQDKDSTHIKRRKSPEMQAEAAADRAKMLAAHGIFNT